MSEYSVISKGTYTTPETGTVRAVNYIFVREENKKFLLLKFINERDERLGGMNVEITQKNSSGAVIDVIRLKLDRVNGAKSGEFVLNRKIPVDDKCVRCDVTVTDAFYGRYSYSQSDGGINLDYVPAELRREFLSSGGLKGADGKNRVTERAFKGRTLIGVFACLMLICALVFTYFQITDFTKNQTTFLYGGVEYAFENDDRREGGPVYVCNYEGVRADIDIPATIEGHPVARIANGAFKNNTRIRSVNIEGVLEIGDNAFSNCINLERLDVEKVRSIGNKAFYKCTELRSIKAGNLRSIGDSAFFGCLSLESADIYNKYRPLEMGRTVFGECTKLKDVSITQEIEYGKYRDIFNTSLNLENLTLANFTAEDGNGNYTVSSLFAVQSAGMIGLKNLVINKLDSISVGFLEGIKLESFTVNELDSSEIGDNAFKNCSKLKAVNLPLAVTKVGLMGFYNTAVESLDASALKEIAPFAFAKCSALKNFSLKDNTVCESIGYEAFRECASLESFYVPENVTSLEGEMFSDCASLKEVYFNSAFPMTEINDGMFGGCSSLVKVTLPSSVRRVGKSAFSDCASLPAFGFENIQSIGEKAFSGCTSLSNVAVPSSVVSIGKGAFQDSGIKRLTVPYIGESEVSNRFMSYIFGSSSYASAQGVPSTLESINVTGAGEVPAGAFYGFANLKEVIIPDTVSRIGASAFCGCTSLTDILIPSFLTAVDAEAFKDCVSLKRFALPYGTGVIGEKAFSGCKSFTEIAVPDSVLSIGASAFEKCNNLVSYTAPFIGGSANYNSYFSYVFGNVPDSLEKTAFTNLKTVADSAFSLCTHLKSVILNEGVTSINSNAFVGCYSLTDINLPESLTLIGTNAFYNCRSLKYVTLPENLYSIGYGAFGECFRLYEVRNNSPIDLSYQNCSILDNAVAVYSKYDTDAPKIYVDGYTLLNNGENIYLIDYPDGQSDFVLPAKNGISNIGDYIIANNLFRECEINSVVIPECVKAFGNLSFAESSVTQVTFAGNSRLSDLGQMPFYNCQKLKEFSLPSGVEIVYDMTFNNCVSLAQINFTSDSKLKHIGSYAFINTKISTLKIPDSVEYIGDQAFGNCTDLSVVELSDGMLSVIGFGAFYGCSSLKEIKLPSSLTFIGGSAFENCSSLEFAEFANYGRLSEIGAGTFAYCENLESITVPENVRTIGEGAFTGCKSLKSIQLPSSLESIENSAFSQCMNLRVVINYSPLPITAESSDFGYVAQNSVYVIDNAKDAGNLSYLTRNGVEYVHIAGTGDWAVTGCSEEVKELNLSPFSYDGEEVKTIRLAPYAFINSFNENYSLEKVTLSYAVKYAGANTFYNCRNLTEVEIADNSLKEISKGMFSFCSALRKVTLPAGLQSIGDEAFYYCYALSEIYFPDSLKTVGNYAFYMCENLEKLNLNRVEKLGYYAFADNYSLREVTVTKSVADIGEYAFNGCSNLLIVYNLGAMNITERSSGYGNVAVNAIKVFTSADDYAYFTEDSDFGYVNLSGKWFVYKYKRASMTVTLPDSFEYNGQFITEYGLKSYTFGSSISSVVIPESLVSIERNTFYSYNILTVYYKGNEESWNKVNIKDNVYMSVYYYKDCVHGDSEWTYLYGSINTRKDVYGFESEKQEATCTAQGYEKMSCTNCGYFYTVTLPVTGHKYVDGVCVMCGKES